MDLKPATAPCRLHGSETRNSHLIQCWWVGPSQRGTLLSISTDWLTDKFLQGRTKQQEKH